MWPDARDLEIDDYQRALLTQRHSLTGITIHYRGAAQYEDSVWSAFDGQMNFFAFVKLRNLEIFAFLFLGHGILGNLPGREGALGAASKALPRSIECLSVLQCDNLIWTRAVQDVFAMILGRKQDNHPALRQLAMVVWLSGNGLTLDLSRLRTAARAQKVRFRLVGEYKWDQDEIGRAHV